MPKSNTKESFYDLLRVSSKASLSEITTAYLTAKNAYSKDSIATYSIMGTEETTKALQELEEAYTTLANPSRRHQYDQGLSSSQVINLNVSPEPAHSPCISTPVPSGETTEPVAAEQKPTQAQHPVEGEEHNLIRIREAHGYSLEDVSRITKIPVRYLKSIESYDTKTLPAKVYVQGFLKNLAHLYRLDPKKTVSTYFEQLEKLSGSSSA